ncbi:MAG: HD domain-containing protein [Candidatus Eisenbacteria bacterium]|nr:HD domain-containing protein [Candidatus Eisenbacteria bacterium]
MSDESSSFAPESLKRILQAVTFAARAHGHQKRKTGDVPYVLHPLRVAQLLAETGGGERVIIAGLLHDTLEDTQIGPEEIESTFGAQVRKIVEGCTEPDRSESWENRKQHTLDALKTAPREILLVTWADKFDNIRSIVRDLDEGRSSIWEHFKRGRDSQEWFYRSLVASFRDRFTGADARLAELLAVEVDTVFGPEKKPG